MSVESLAQANYIAIESYRRNKAAVRTPVWITAEAEKLYSWTLANSGKVKRIRRESRVKLAKCDATGNIKGDWVAASARVLDCAEAVQRQAQRMREKYGLKSLPFRILPRLRGTKPVVIEFAAESEFPK